MELVGEHPVPVGPLAVRWLAYRLQPFRAGAESTVEVLLRNAGTATWRARGDAGVKLSHHWLDDRGNAIVWDGPRVDFGGPGGAGRRERRRRDRPPRRRRDPRPRLVAADPRYPRRGVRGRGRLDRDA